MDAVGVPVLSPPFGPVRENDSRPSDEHIGVKALDGTLVYVNALVTDGSGGSPLRVYWDQESLSYMFAEYPSGEKYPAASVAIDNLTVVGTVHQGLKEGKKE